MGFRKQEIRKCNSVEEHTKLQTNQFIIFCFVFQ